MLVFEGVEDRSLLELGVLLRDIETLYWLCVEVGEVHERVAAQERYMYLRPRVERIQLGSPLEISLELVEVIWRVGVGFTFAGALAMIFKLPARFQKERWQFWQTRLAADKAKRDWIEWTEAQYHQSPVQLDDLILPEEAGKYLPHEES